MQFSVEPWTSVVNAKGQLQQAWFKLGGILADQRGLRTIAKIGGLVGKTIQIDESTRFNRDFVRVKIACRNVDLVPPSAECNLGLYIYDFFFKREALQEDNMINLGVADSMENPETQASPKRPRTYYHGPSDSGTKTSKGKDPVTDSFQGKQHCRTGSVVDVAVRLSRSAPSKLMMNKVKTQFPNLVEKDSEDHMGVEEAIPVATYVPIVEDLSDDSDSSTNFEK